jgi:hypothetical protein
VLGHGDFIVVLGGGEFGVERRFGDTEYAGGFGAVAVYAALRVAASGFPFMSGIQYIVDEHGKPTSVVIDLKKHAELWENMYDAMIVRSRRREPRESLASVKARLIKTGKLRG